MIQFQSSSSSTRSVPFVAAYSTVTDLARFLG